MALSNPRIIFGIHSISPYRRSDKMPYGILKVIGSANLSLSSDIEQLFAGSNKFAWAAEAKTVNSELSAKVKAYPGFLFELFLGATVTDSGADASGTISTITNASGSSLVSATTGVASVSVIPTTGAANLKFGKYVAKVTGAAAIKLYLLSDIDATRGTDASYVGDDLEISGPHTITSGADTDVAALGLRFEGGSGAISMTVGDTATFEVKPPSTSSSEIVVGSSTTTFPAFGALLMAQKRATGELFEIDAHNCIASGLPIALEEQAFSQPEIKMQCLYDSTLDRVFSIRAYTP
jgi:hypothetical protein